MTPKEKAEDFFNKMLFEIEYNCQPSLCKLVARDCAIIMANELERQEGDLMGYKEHKYSSEYWQEVEQHLRRI